MNIHRYNDKSISYSNLDRMEDVLSWIRGLRSKGRTAKILKEAHGIRGRKKIESRSSAISEYAETAVTFLEQGLAGPVETSFVSLYYGMLNLSKIYISCSDQYVELRRKKHRLHGVTTLPNWGKSRDFLKDTIVLHPNGSIPIFYKVLTGEEITSKVAIKLRELYPFISDISHEYSDLFGVNRPLQQCSLELIQDDANGHFIRLTHTGEVSKNANHKQRNQVLKNFNKVGKNIYETNKMLGNFEQVSKQLKNDIRRFLLYEYAQEDFRGNENVYTFSPISAKKLLFPEEIPILLAFFHLSYIVRYYPDLLFQLKDSPEWGMIQTLSRHGTYKFLVLFWSYIEQRSFFIHTR